MPIEFSGPPSDPDSEHRKRADRAIEELAELGCDAEILRGLVQRACPGWGTTTRSRAGSKKRHKPFKSMDSLKQVLDPFSTQDLTDLQRSVKAMAKKLRKVNGTPLVRFDADLFQKEYARETVNLLKAYADEFLPDVLKKAKVVAATRRASYRRRILDVLDNVRNRTGACRYRLVKDALVGYSLKISERSLQEMVRRRRASTSSKPI